MSYKIRVLRDNPIGFWPLDEIYSSIYSIATYNDSTEFYNATSYYNSGGQVGVLFPNDYSGCENHGSYVGDFPLNDNVSPLVMGLNYGTIITSVSSISLPVTNNYYGQSVTGGGFANSKSSDNDFSLEIWLSPNITTSNRTTIFADTANGIGIFYENNTIVFKLNAEELYYTVNGYNKSLHIVASYSLTSMKLYVDGYLATAKILNNFKFTNSSTGPFTIGPTENSSDSFIIDAPAIYRYALDNKKVYSHYTSGIYHINPLQLVNYDGGYFFPCHEENIKPIFEYSYDRSKFRTIINSDTYYNEQEKYIGFYKSTGAKSLVVYDSIELPTSLAIVSSKIEWRADKNIIVEMGTDGTTYPYTLTNGSYLPLYNKEASITIGKIYLKITFSTSDSSKYFPKFSKFNIKFYGSKDLPSDNSGYYITSTTEYSPASFNYPTLLRMKNDGIQTSATGGFKINVDQSMSTVEFFYTPSALTASTLLNNTAANISWNGSGVVSKTNINKIYINGVDKSAETSAGSLFVAGNMHHVVIVFTTAITGDIKFNYNVSGGPSNKFNNIGIYPKALTASDATRHYAEYVGRPASTVVESSVSLTDGGIKYADTDWIVISTA